MKPIKISIKGFNSFVEEQVIDFEKLSKQGIFGIFGPTGSGKSSVLDAITFALYGQIARNKNKREKQHYINALSSAARVVFEFEIHSDCTKAYKMIREVKRKKNDKDSPDFYSALTSECKFISLSDGVILADRDADVQNEINRIIGLEYDDFVKTVVLPQGGFQDFLKMTKGDRGNILERVFGLEKYGIGLENKLAAAKKNAELERKEYEGALSAYGEISEEMIKAKEENLKKLNEDLRLLEEEKKTLDEKYNRVKSVFELQKRLEDLEKGLAEEEEKKPEMLKIEEELKAAERAGLLDSPIKSYQDFSQKAKSAADTLRISQEELELNDKAYEEANSLYTQLNEGYNDRQPKLVERLSLLKSALERWQAYTKYMEQLQDIEKESKELTAIQEQKKHLKAEASKAQSTILEEIEKGKAFIKENKVSTEERNLVVKALGIYDKMGTLREQDDKESEELERKRAKLAETEKKNEDERYRWEEVKDELSTIHLELGLYQEQPFMDPGYYFKQKQLIMDDKAELEELAQKQKELNTLNAALGELQKKSKELDEASALVEEEYRMKSSEYESFILESSVHAIRASLHEGDSCPVCSNIVTELNLDHFKHELDSELQTKLKEELQAIEAEKNRLYQEKTELEVNQTTQLKLKKELEAYLQLKEKGENKENLDRRLKELEFENKKFREELQSFEERKKNLELEDLNIKHNLEIGTKLISDYRMDLNKLCDKRQALEQEIAHLEKEFAKLTGGEDENPKKRLKELDDKQDKIDKMEEMLEELDGSRKEKEKELDSLNADVVNHDIALAELEARRKEVEKKQGEEGGYLSKLLGEARDPGDDFRKTEEELHKMEGAYKEAKECKELRYDLLQKALQQRDLAENELKSYKNLLLSSRNELIDKIELFKMADLSTLEDVEKEESLAELIALISSDVLTEEERTVRKNKLDAHMDNMSKKKGEIESIKKSMGGVQVSEAYYLEIEKHHEDLAQEYLAHRDSYSKEEKDLEGKREAWERAKELNAKLEKMRRRYEVLKELSNVIKGRAFAEFMALKQLDYVTVRATEILSRITNGGYYLEVDEGGDFKIRDNVNGGALRDVKTLSGGETFVVSLALALALSEQIQLKGVAPLELFFLDEGFGTLDKDLLDIVMDALERLHHDRLKIGIISHVEDLKQRIPIKLNISPARIGEGGSRVRIEYS